MFGTEQDHAPGPKPTAKNLDLDAIKLDTNNFANQNCIVSARYRTIFKVSCPLSYVNLLNSYEESVIFDFAQGTLPDFGDLAVKRLNTEAGLEELKNEMKMLARLDHPNIIRMLGSCIGNNENVICYEHMPGGSLDAVLFGMYFL